MMALVKVLVALLGLWRGGVGMLEFFDLRGWLM